ncbi:MULTISPECIES: rSAM-modified peptide [Flavobacterium]|nr:MULTISPECIES: rSAM-modified peptide [Flavobacterium]MCR4031912.1 rSAM-modified peptide [Flavobacterium panacis]
MKTKTFTFKDFQADTISKKEQKTIMGGGNDTDPNDPRKNNGGNGNP